MKINLNDTIKVKLTEYGLSIYYHRYDKILEEYPRLKNTLRPKYPDVDNEGYTEFQLWDFISLYVDYMYCGAENVIDPIEIVVNDNKT